MKAVIQRSKHAKVTVEKEVRGEIEEGLVILLGVTHDDESEDAEYLAKKISNLRIFEDQNQKMNLSLKDSGGKVLSISQFTLYGDTRKGRRPNFMAAASPEKAKGLYREFNTFLQAEGIQVAEGEFGAMMQVELINDGPVTFILDSRER